MQFGICDLSLIPVRSGPSHQFEQVTQLLFGETYEIVSKQDDWVKIISDNDGYNGWIAGSQLKILPDQLYFQLKKEPSTITLDLVSAVTIKNHTKYPFPLYILAGSCLPFYAD